MCLTFVDKDVRFPAIFEKNGNDNLIDFILLFLKNMDALMELLTLER
jgi:hypothetical protein